VVASRDLASPAKRRGYLWAMVFGGLIVSTEVYAQRFLGHGLLVPWNKTFSIVGTIGNPNYVGAYLLFPILAVLAVVLSSSGDSLPNRVGCGIASLILLGSFFLSRARASWLGLGIGLALLGWWLIPRKVWIAGMLWAVLAMQVGLTWYPNAWEHWGDTKTLNYRLRYWWSAVELWKQSPVFGLGTAAYRFKVYDAQAQIGQKHPWFWKGYVEPKPRRPHNDYLEALVDGGLLYAVTFFGLVGYVLVRAVKRSRASPSMRAMIAGQAAVLVSALFFFPFHLTETQALFWLNLGILEGQCSGS
jgi:O-antigen ligase